MISEEEAFCAIYPHLSDKFNFFYYRGMYWEDFFYPKPFGHFSYGNGRTWPISVFYGDNHPFIELNTLFFFTFGIFFPNFLVNFYNHS